LYKVSDEGVVDSNLTHAHYSPDGLVDLQVWFATQGLKIPQKRPSDIPIRRFDMDLADWMQGELETIVLKRLSHIVQASGIPNVCVTGGVALNSVMNRSVADYFGDEHVYVPFSPGDAGMSIGAISVYLENKQNMITKFNCDPYLGGGYSDSEIYEALISHQRKVKFEKSDNLISDSAKIILSGDIVGWFQGKSEFGPRALGNRSILGLPSNPWIKEVLNHQVKLREWFRPYAPVVIEADSTEYFDVQFSEPYMMKTANVKVGAKSRIPACVHVDGTARLQTVSEASNKLLYDLLNEIQLFTNVPVLINTSFNLNGMPIVESPKDAIDCFIDSEGLGHLIIGNYIVKKVARDD